ncbi:Chitin synthase, class 6 [Coemansia erecta]|nr:Chitin synthase, class 6 [Coemansia sp. RSA 2618]KAJ2829025.1 Chitin synthase, class 6 [Coemansia erecta]
MQTNYDCMKRLFYVGKVDERQSVRCLFTNYMLVAFACVLMLVVLVKFLTALQFGNKSRPSPPDKFVVCQVPCYTEDEESILKTIESLAGLDYEDKSRLLFIICDGNIVGSGNEKSTPRIVLDTLGVDPEYDPPGRDYLAIAEGSRRHNIGKVYSGLYEFEGHRVPFIVVVKVGTPDEANRSGNRGKRDSQILLMSFFNKVHFNLPMTPLELEIYHQMRHIIGVPPRNYEYLLQVDADTEVMPDSLSRLVSACTGDRRIAGICGETMLGNESQSWTTMMQVYEYFISHHMAKAFESLFGSVTCLPGCFSMFRLRTTDGKPLLIHKNVLEAYSELHVDTLHKKNLLSLGEDRYLTTLMMKHFPKFKLKFIQDAKCKTIAPEKWSVLVSQRRRWINSTVHNLAELIFLADMCGFCCFSMRFVVFLDLFGTLTMPTTLIYFAYLIYAAVRNIADVGYISLILIGAIYGVQAIIFILRREWQHVGWMFIYLLAYPLWSFVLPVYSFWHMDDFSWGNTRVVVGDGKRKIIIEDDKEFDPASIPQRKWMEYEKELAAAGVLNAPPPNMNPNAGSNKEDDRLSLYSSQSGAHLSRAESAMAFTQMPGGGGTPQSMYGQQPQPQSMYGQPQPQSMYGYDPRLSVAMANPQMLAMQQQQHMSAAGSVYDSPMVRHSTASSGAMTPVDPRLSTAMYNPQLHQMQQQQQQQQDAWMPPTMSMYGQQQQMMDPAYTQYVPMQDLGGSRSGRSTPGMFPSDDQIIDAIRRILVNADLSTTTKKVIRAQLVQEFGVDLSPKKDFISKIVDQMLIGGA